MNEMDSGPAGDPTGIVIIYCGPGKGKTTSAIGLAIRAAGHGIRTSIVQFIKNQPCGEHRALARLGELIEIHLMGSGFVFRHPPPPQAVEAAREALRLLSEQLCGGRYGLVIADEILGALAAELICLADIEALLDCRPAGVTLVLTGRDAPPQLLERADLVSRIEAVKHPYDRGLAAQAGIEY